MSLYTHWACFDCRKSFQRLRATNASIAERQCPECDNMIFDMGVYFEAPQWGAKKAWAILELVSRSGYRFHTEGNKAFIDSFILTASRPTLEGVRRRIEVLRPLDAQSRIQWRTKRYKERRKKRRTPTPD